MVSALTQAYLAYLPWFGLVVGMILVVLGASTRPPGRRVLVIGLGLALASLVALLVQHT